MKKKYLIFGATGSIGSSLANQLYEEKKDCHLVGRNELETKKLAEKLNQTEIIRNFEDNLKRNNASVVLFSTVAAKKGFINHSIISSAKSGVEGLTVALAAEFAPSIRVNCIAPSLTKSKMAKNVIKNSKIEESIAKLHPLKRIGEGVDAAYLANFLLSKNSSWITGQIIGVDGGRAAIA